MESAYNILNQATTRQLQNLETFRSDIEQKQRVASARSLGGETQGGFLENNLNMLQNEYIQAKNDILADKNTQIQILDEQRKQRKAAERRQNKQGAGAIIGGIIGGVAGAFLHQPALGFQAGSAIGGDLGGLS